jgi:sulfur relay (sulfurtransferase) DsrC/TusE family protein
MLATTKNIDIESLKSANSEKLSFSLTAFIEYKLKAEIAEFTHEKIEELADAFWEIDAFVEKFVVMYEGSKTIKLLVPIKNSTNSMLEAGIALGEFKQVIDTGELLDYLSVQSGVECYDDYLPYCYTS